MKLTTRAAGLLAASLLLAVPLAAQRPTDIVKWSAKPIQAEIKAGAIVQVEITADVQPGWFLYGLTQPKGGPIPLRFARGAAAPLDPPWSGRRDLNPRPQRPERCALPNCATSRAWQV